MSYDRADWHSGGDFPPECGGTHIGMFLAWAITNGLEGEFHHEESPSELRRVRAREMTGRAFLFHACDGKFWEEDLSQEGNAFARHYYAPESGGYGPYLDDYESTLAQDRPSVYHVEDTWDNYDFIAKVIDRRYTEWKERSGPAPAH